MSDFLIGRIIVLMHRVRGLTRELDRLSRENQQLRAQLHAPLHRAISR